MSKSAVVITGSILFGCFVFALSPGPVNLIHNPTGLELREQLVYLTGVCAMSLMVMSVIISVRFPWVSSLLKGLDKGYVVHKWTGILSTVFIISHYLLENAPHWLIDLGMMPNPGELSDGTAFSALEIDLFQSGTLLAQPALYVMIVLVAIALLKDIPYHWFRKSHKVFPVVFLLAAYHGATAQLKERWLGSPGSYLLLIMLSIGAVAAIIALSQNIGASRKMKAAISSICLHSGNILELYLTMANSRFQYRPGQFVFLKFPHSAEPHPFSIASFDEERRSLRFVIKGTGGFTSQLPGHIRRGQTVELEGPYGEFHFNDSCKRQVWIAGGIGITPFLSRLEYLTRNKNGATVNFWYCTRTSQAESFPPSLRESCLSGGITFHHLNSSQQEYLTIETIKSKIGNLQDTSIWFCGPREFGECLMKDLRSLKFDMRNFHYDSFEMR